MACAHYRPACVTVRYRDPESGEFREEYAATRAELVDLILAMPHDVALYNIDYGTPPR